MELCPARLGMCLRETFIAQLVSQTLQEKIKDSLLEMGWNVLKWQCPLPLFLGGGGLVFCVFSYKNGIRVGVINENVMSRDQANKLVQHVQNEFETIF